MEHELQVSGDSGLSLAVSHDAERCREDQQSSLQRFLRAVVHDGRFIDTVKVDPRNVAETLGIELSPADERSLKERPLESRITELYGKPMAIVWGPIVVVAGVAILLGIVVVVAWKYSKNSRSGEILPIRDLSSHAALKL